MKTRNKNKIKQQSEQTKELNVHFNTKEHRISLDEFVQTVSSYEIIANNIADNIFNTKKGIKIYILPPQEGTFDLSMLLWVSAAAATGIIGAASYDTVKGFIKGVTKRLELKNFPDGFDLENSAELLGNVLTGFMLETSEEVQRLEKLIPKGKNIDEAIKAKSDFYNMCTKSKEINGLGFTHDDNFVLDRSDFITRGVPPSIKPLPVKVELKELIIVKPVNVEEDLQWDLKDKNTKESLTARMADENFKEMLFNGKCPQRKNASPDIIIATVEYYKNLKNGKESKSEYIITDVYKFNRKTLKKLPENMKLNRKKNVAPKNIDGAEQLSLFKKKNVE